MVDGVCLHLVENLNCVRQRLRHIGKHLVHLLTGLEPLLLGVEHTVGVIEVVAGG